MDTEHNLLFGVLALQADLIDAVQFAEACTAWSQRKEQPFAELLLERGWITEADKAHVEYLLERKLKKHGGDARASLASVADDGVLRSLAAIDDSAIQHSLANWTPPLSSADPWRTRPGIGLPKRSPSGRTPLLTPTSETKTRERYSRIGLHAVGGIGQVWLSRDRDLGRTVALKELRPEAAGSLKMRARFLEEARITGQLEHPGIVPVYELARRADTQQPFYTMRFLKGRTLTEAVRAYHQKRVAGEADPLDLLGLLNAFVAVCNAVAYAHARGVVHRDLKGQNVVLGDFGEVSVLDWGLAKVMHRLGSNAEMPPIELEQEPDREQTLHGQVLGTPGYMAPEQAAGRQDQIDSHTDVYGLGAVLYEILTRRPPFTGADTEEVLQKVQAEEPVRPSHLCAGVPPALEAICLRALAKEPADRYPSAADLAKDVQRWLADEPVTAYREPWTARLGRWARRHRPIVAGAATLLVTAVAALCITGMLIGQQKARAEANLQMAVKAMDGYIGIAKLSYYENPIQAEAAYQGALNLFQDLVHDYPAVPEYQNKLALCLNNLGVLYKSSGRIAEAEDFYRKALDIQHQLSDRDPGNLDYQGYIAGYHNNLAEVYRDTRQPDKARQQLEMALAIREKIVRQAPEDFRYQSELAQSHNNLGQFYRMIDRLPEAMTHHKESLAIREKLAHDHPSVTTYRIALGQSHANLGGDFTKMGQLEDAASAFKRAVTIFEELFREHPSDIALAIELSSGYLGMGYFFTHQKQHENAIPWYSRAIHTLEGAFPRGQFHRKRQTLCDAFWSRAQALCALKRYAEALPDWDRALVLDEGPNHEELRLNRAEALARAGRHAQATAQADALAKEKGLQAGTVYQLACIFSLSSAVVHSDTGLPRADREKLTREYTTRALELLARAQAAGYFQSPAALETMKKDEDLDPLRGRDDFRKLLKEWERETASPQR